MRYAIVFFVATQIALAVLVFSGRSRKQAHSYSQVRLSLQKAQMDTLLWRMDALEKKFKAIRTVPVSATDPAVRR